MSRPPSRFDPLQRLAEGEVEVRRGRGLERLGDRLAELAEPVEDVVVLAGEPLEGPLVVVDPVPQDDPDDPPLLVGEEVVEPVDAALELAGHQRGDVGQRAAAVGLDEPPLEVVVRAGERRRPEDGVEVEPAVVDHDEVGLRLVPGPVRPGAEPADGEAAAAAAADLLVEHLEVERVRPLVGARATGRSG